MTIEIAKFKCPACGNAMGEKEYIQICNAFNKKVQDTCNEQIEKLKGMHEEEVYILEEKNRQKMQQQDERHRIEIENKVNQQVQLQLTENEENSKERKNNPTRSIGGHKTLRQNYCSRNVTGVVE